MRAVEIAVQASMGLHACHVERVLHRDIKPGNLFLHHEAELGEVVKIIDFGISHLGMGPAITSLNATSGTRRYMAPEQARGQDDERADQFSLAAVLFEMLAGQLPWPMPKRNDGGEHERFVASGQFKNLRAMQARGAGGSRGGRDAGAVTGPGAAVRIRVRVRQAASSLRRPGSPGRLRQVRRQGAGSCSRRSSEFSW